MAAVISVLVPYLLDVVSSIGWHALKHFVKRMRSGTKGNPSDILNQYTSILDGVIHTLNIKISPRMKERNLDSKLLNTAKSKLNQANISFGSLKIPKEYYPLVGFCYASVDIAEFTLKEIEANWDALEDEEILTTLGFFRELGIRLFHICKQIKRPIVKGISKRDIFEKNLVSDKFMKRMLICGAWNLTSKIIPDDEVFENDYIVAEVFREQIDDEISEEGILTIEELAHRRGVKKDTIQHVLVQLIEQGLVHAIITSDDNLVSISRIKEMLYQKALSPEGVDSDFIKQIGLDERSSCTLLLEEILNKQVIGDIR